MPHLGGARLAKVADEAFCIEPMTVNDLDQVRRIERASFPSTWPRNSYRREILKNEKARYMVVRSDGARGVSGDRAKQRFPWSIFPFGRRRPRDVVAYAGLWIVIDKAHITTIAVDPQFRRRGIGELLIVEMAKLAMLAGAVSMTLEVRMSNQSAQALYRKYGFSEGGVRPRYYSDDFEDALIMQVEDLTDDAFGARVEAGEQELRRRLMWSSEL